MPEYKKAPSAMRECIGPECTGCSSANCYGHGGRVKRHDVPASDEAGVHEPIAKYQPGKSGGTSVAGDQFRRGNPSGAKHMHKMNLEDLKQMNTKKPELYSDGGEVDEDENDGSLDKNYYVKGTHRPFAGQGKSQFGEATRGHWSYGSPERNKKKAVREHEKVIGEMRSMKKPHLYAEGGAVDSWTKREDNERGVHGGIGKTTMQAGKSMAGVHARSMKEHPEEADVHKHRAGLYHKKVLGEMRGMKKPELYAQGGEVEEHSGSDGDEGMEDELKHAMGGEFMSAMERKDRKGIMSALEAIVLSCRGKE